jgi:hypothetical protein
VGLLGCNEERDAPGFLFPLGRAREAAGHYEDWLSGQMNGNFVFFVISFSRSTFDVF